MKKNLKISKKNYETVFSFRIEGTMGDIFVPTPPPTPPTPPPTPTPIIPPFPPLNIPPGIPPGMAIPPVPPYYTPQTWVEILYVEEVSYRFRNGDNEQGLYLYTLEQQTTGWGYSFPTDWGRTETMIGYYPEKDFVPTGSTQVIALAILSPHHDGFFTDMNNPPDWFSPLFTYPAVTKSVTKSFIINPSGPTTIG